MRCRLVGCGTVNQTRSRMQSAPRGVVQTPAVKKLVAFLVVEARRADVR
jgi:hypothetical protein